MNEETSITPANDKLWNVLCHLSPFLGLGLILPLIVYLVTKGDPISTIPAHARETLNFHISLLIYGIVGGLLIIFLVGVVVLLAVGIMGIVLGIIGAIKASNGEVYHYPLTIRLVT